jgi:hypothetical protein
MILHSGVGSILRIKKHPIIDFKDQKKISFYFNNKKLDGFEGVKNGHYFRTKVSIEIPDNGIKEAEIYKANQNKIKEGLKPTREYLKHLLAGKDILSERYYIILESCQTAVAICAGVAPAELIVPVGIATLKKNSNPSAICVPVPGIA